MIVRSGSALPFMNQQSVLEGRSALQVVLVLSGALIGATS